MSEARFGALSPHARHEAVRAAWNEAAVRYTERVDDTVTFGTFGRLPATFSVLARRPAGAAR